MAVEYKWEQYVRVLSSSICPPAVRMVLVECSIDDGRKHTHFNPVVALRSRVLQRWTKRYISDIPVPPATVSDLVKEGWYLESQEEETQPLVTTYDMGIVDKDYIDQSENVISTTAVCPWPSDEDGKRLEDTVTHLFAQLEDRMRSCEERLSREAAERAAAEALAQQEGETEVQTRSRLLEEFSSPSRDQLDSLVDEAGKGNDVVIEVLIELADKFGVDRDEVYQAATWEDVSEMICLAADRAAKNG